jgi:phage N-6-adenine-methyltransferase
MTAWNGELLFASKETAWRTPPEVFGPLDDEFHFTLDAAANADNHLCRRWLGPGSPLAEDALSTSWLPFLRRGDTVWLNPPYGRGIGQWIAKARQEADSGLVVVALVLARTDTRWWHDHVPFARKVRFGRGRVRFLRTDGSLASSATAPSALIVWSFDHHGPPDVRWGLHPQETKETT